MDANAQPANNQPTAVMLTQANLARIRGQWTEAIEICVAILRAEPGNADAHSLLGDINRDQGALDEACQWYRMAADIRPNGSDAAKLRQAETERARKLGYAPAGPPSTSLAPTGTDSGGTTQLMGLSPKRWLNTLTIVSAGFLAATLLVLIMMQTSQRQNAPAARNLALTPHVLMPTAESGNILPPLNPNRATVLPAGEQPRQNARPHETGSGLEPDRAVSSRTAPISQPARPPVETNPALQQPGAPYEAVPPAPVRTVQPITHTLPSRSEGVDRGAESLPAQGGRAIGVSGQAADNDTPASETNAGNAPLTSEERDRLNQGH